MIDKGDLDVLIVLVLLVFYGVIMLLGLQDVVSQSAIIPQHKNMAIVMCCGMFILTIYGDRI